MLKMKIFLGDADFVRFIHYLFFLNDQDTHIRDTNLSYKLSIKQVQPALLRKPRKLLVEILGFVLMDNHFHLILRQKVNGGIVKFMQRLGTAYTMYMNEKYDRGGGHVFCGGYKARMVDNDSYFLYLPYYVHLNPLDVAFPKWKEKGIKDPKEAIRFLESYRWSSYPDYIGKENFPSVTQRDFLLESFGGPKPHQREINQWIKEKSLEKLGTLSAFDFK